VATKPSLAPGSLSSHRFDHPHRAAERHAPILLMRCQSNPQPLRGSSPNVVACLGERRAGRADLHCHANRRLQAAFAREAHWEIAGLDRDAAQSGPLEDAAQSFIVRQGKRPRCVRNRRRYRGQQVAKAASGAAKSISPNCDTARSNAASLSQADESASTSVAPPSIQIAQVSPVPHPMSSTRLAHASVPQLGLGGV
jgi:hypothetical protein